MKTALSVAMTFALTLVFILATTFATAQSLRADEPKNVPLHSAITRVQPMTGIVLWTSNDKNVTDAVSLEFRYCGYNEVVNANGTYDFKKIDSILDEVAKRNHQAVLRFYYVYPGKKTTVPNFIRKRSDYDETIGISEKKKTHFCDWSNQALKDFTLEFYTRIARRYEKDNRLAYLQTGFGLWAEYHIYDGPKEIGKTFPSKEYQERFVRQLDKTFNGRLTWSVSVDAVDDNYSPFDDNEELLGLNFGVFDDSFLCKQHAKENELNWIANGLDRWKRVPAGGEFSYYTKRDQKLALAESGPHGIPFSHAAKKFHLTYICGNDQPKYQTFETIAKASMAIGYKFRVTACQREGNTLRLTVTNEGVAPIYQDAYFAAGTKRSKTSLRGLLPGESLACTIREVDDTDLKSIAIQCDAILKSQSIQFNADLR